MLPSSLLFDQQIPSDLSIGSHIRTTENISPKGYLISVNGGREKEVYLPKNRLFIEH